MQRSKDHLGSFATDKGDWNVCYLHLHGLNFQHNLNMCPVTAEVVGSIKRHYNHCFFSALAPDTHVIPQ